MVHNCPCANNDADFHNSIRIDNSHRFDNRAFHQLRRRRNICSRANKNCDFEACLFKFSYVFQPYICVSDSNNCIRILLRIHFVIFQLIDSNFTVVIKKTYLLKTTHRLSNFLCHLSILPCSEDQQIVVHTMFLLSLFSVSALSCNCLFEVSNRIPICSSLLTFSASSFPA